MTHRRVFIVLLAVFAGGCAGEPVPTMSFAAGARVAVFPPNNQTGDMLLVAGASAFEEYVLRSDRVTVPDLLAAEARLQLARRGFAVVSPDAIDAATRDQAPASAQDAAAMALRNKIEGAVLYIDVRRWEPDAPFHPAYVIAAVDVTLIDPSTGHVLWTATRGPRPKATPGSVILGDAYVTAARAVMDELLRPLKPAPSR